MLLFCRLLFPATRQYSVNSLPAYGSVDFRNFDYGSPPGDNRIVLYGGRSKDRTFGRIDNRLAAVRYADFDGDGKEEAVVVITTDLFGSGGYDKHYYVFAYRAGAPRKIFQEHRQQGRGLRIKRGALIIVAPYWDNPIPHCCPRYIETTAYRFNGSRFVVSKRWLKRNLELIDYYSKRGL